METMMKKVMLTGLILIMAGCAPYARDKDHRKDHDKKYYKKDDRRDYDGKKDHDKKNDRDEQRDDDGRYEKNYR